MCTTMTALAEEAPEISRIPARFRNSRSLLSYLQTLVKKISSRSECLSARLFCDGARRGGACEWFGSYRLEFIRLGRIGNHVKWHVGLIDKLGSAVNSGQIQYSLNIYKCRTSDQKIVWQRSTFFPKHLILFAKRFLVFSAIRFSSRVCSEICVDKHFMFKLFFQLLRTSSGGCGGTFETFETFVFIVIVKTFYLRTISSQLI